MKRLTKPEAKDALMHLLKRIGKQLRQYEISEYKDLTHCKFPIGNGFVEIGFQWSRSKMFFWSHIQVPKLIHEIDGCLAVLTILFAYSEECEVYLNGDYCKDWQHGIIYDSSHRMQHTFYTKGAEYVLAQEIKVMQGEGKFSLLSLGRKLDYDYIYQTL